MDSGETGMNLVAITVIHPSWESNQRPPILKSCTQLTELRVLGLLHEKKCTQEKY